MSACSVRNAMEGAPIAACREHGAAYGLLAAGTNLPFAVLEQARARPSLGVRAHHDAAERGPADLGESGRGKHALRADVNGRILYRWHWHRDESPRVPNTAWRSPQLASSAPTILSSSVIATPARSWQLEPLSPTDYASAMAATPAATAAAPAQRAGGTHSLEVSAARAAARTTLDSRTAATGAASARASAASVSP